MVKVAADVLLDLVDSARRIQVVAARVVRVDRASVAGVEGAGQRVLVEALLIHDAIGVV